MLEIDSTAYPHIVERILVDVIVNASSVSALLSWRKTNRHCRDLADARLFHHAVVRRTPLNEIWAAAYSCKWFIVGRDDRPVGFLGPPVIVIHKPQFIYHRLVEWVHAGKTSIEFAPARLSGISADAPLPMLPWKVAILDIEGSGRAIETSFQHATAPSDEFMAKPFHLLVEPKRYPPLMPKVYPPPMTPRTTPLILRRFGSAPQEPWEGDNVGTVVDFYCAGRWRERSYLPKTKNYVRHLEWLDHPRYNLSKRFYIDNHGGPVEQGTLVLAAHCTPPRIDVGVEEVVNFSRHFAEGLLKGQTVFTVVGLESWLPGIDQDLLRREMIRVAHLSNDRVAYWGGWDATIQSRFRFGSHTMEELEAAYAGVRFLTLEEWWDELGDMKDLVGVWPVEQQTVHERGWTD